MDEHGGVGLKKKERKNQEEEQEKKLLGGGVSLKKKERRREREREREGNWLGMATGRVRAGFFHTRTRPVGLS